eukprot:1851439-Rhodomonas_salina.1
MEELIAAKQRFAALNVDVTRDLTELPVRASERERERRERGERERGERERGESARGGRERERERVN